MAQTYLEFVRSWTMNTQKQWIFQRVHSSGVLTSSPFTESIVGALGLQTEKANTPVSSSVIDAIAGDESHFQTKDWPDEKGTILKRVRGHKSQGLSEAHFERYEHIICFAKKTSDRLEKMKSILETGPKKIKVVSKIHLLHKCAWANGDNPEKKEDLLKMAGKLKVALKDFLKVHFNWERPAISIASGEWRTLQVLVDEEAAKKMKKDYKVLVNKIWEKKGCTVQVVDDVADKYLVSISGPKDKLADVRKTAISS
ncbi:hypothetical protein N431DRAFT_72963 [Stipitochalara longipes BDJ]|nr:hypothetical protein N431DRAFT_72963 [Stipitochalara longipes BDJ]